MYFSFWSILHQPLGGTTKKYEKSRESSVYFDHPPGGSAVFWSHDTTNQNGWTLTSNDFSLEFFFSAQFFSITQASQGKIARKWKLTFLSASTHNFVMVLSIIQPCDNDFIQHANKISDWAYGSSLVPITLLLD